MNRKIPIKTSQNAFIEWLLSERKPRNSTKCLKFALDIYLVIFIAYNINDTI